jgi:hypothetical protein
MNVSDRDELNRLVRELGYHFPNGGLGPLIVDFANQTRGTSHRSIWDMSDDELLGTVRALAESLKMPVERLSAKALNTEEGQ